MLNRKAWLFPKWQVHICLTKKLMTYEPELIFAKKPLFCVFGRIHTLAPTLTWIFKAIPPINSKVSKWKTKERGFNAFFPQWNHHCWDIELKKVQNGHGNVNIVFVSCTAPLSKGDLIQRSAEIEVDLNQVSFDASSTSADYNK